jgi:hypothetical protein
VNDKPTRSNAAWQTDETVREPEASTPTAWDRHQMEVDDAGEPRERDAEALVPGWNKGEMAEERQDHTRAPMTPPDELDEPAGAMSGHGSNAGGGERWADRDKEG